jgi:hypothetical protein
MRLILGLIATALLALAALSAQGAPAHEANLNLRRSMGNLRPSYADAQANHDLLRSMGNRRPDDVIGPRHRRKHRHHGHGHRIHYYPAYGYPYYAYPPPYPYRYPYYAPIYIPAQPLYGPQALKRFLGVP